MKTAEPYYIVGGTLRPDAPCYVERAADHQLYDCLTRGEFCYVLTSRQMGKSSLMVHTAYRLRQAGYRVVTLDLTALGQNLTAEQWYGGLLELMGEQLQLVDALDEFWHRHRHLGPLQRWMTALREVALPAVRATEPQPLILFVDEIDVVRRLPFCTDEFFAAIRECYNARSSDPALQGLRFCLIGVASPSDLMRDSRSTPFNIGQRIDLDDFTPEQALPLARGLEPVCRKSPRLRSVLGRAQPGATAGAHALLQRVLYWTGGHPYLTQRLCDGLAALPVGVGQADVDRLCSRFFFTSAARQRDDNLLFVRERLLRIGERAAVLTLYDRLLTRHWLGERVADDESDERITHLRLAGVVRGRNGVLQTRNRIYARVFDRHWVVQHLPDGEARRQQAAYRRGVLRTTAVAAVVVLALAGTTGLAYQSQQQAVRLLWEREQVLRDLRQEKRRADQEAALANRAGEEARAQEHLARRETQRAQAQEHRARMGEQRAQSEELRANRSEAERRQRLFHLTVENGMRAAGERDFGGALLWFTEGLELAHGDAGAAFAQRQRIASVLEEAPRPAHVWRGQLGTMAKLLQKGRRALLWAPNGPLQVRDLDTGALLFAAPHSTGYLPPVVSADERWLASAGTDGKVRVWDLRTGRQRGSARSCGGVVHTLALSPHGGILAVGHQELRLYELASGRCTTQRGDGEFQSISFSRDGHFLVTLSAALEIRDPHTGQRVGPLLPKSQNWRETGGVQISPDGRFIVGVRSGSAQLWERSTGKWLGELAHRDVRAVEFSPDSRRVGLASDYRHSVWDLSTRQRLSLVKHGRSLVGFSFSADGSQIQTVTNHGECALWNPETGERITSTRVGGAVLFGACAPAGDRVLTLGATSIQVWQLAMARQPTLSLPPVRSSRLPVVSPDGRFGAVVGLGPVVFIRDLTGGKQHRQLPHPAPVSALAVSPDSRRLVTAGTDRWLRWWDLRTGQRIGKAVRVGGYVEAMAFSRDGAWLRVETTGWRNQVLQVATQRWLGSPFTSVGAQMSPDGQFVVGTAPDNFRLWARRPGGYWDYQVLSEAGVRAFAFSPDSRWLASGCDDGCLRLWDLHTFRPVGVSFRHEAAISHAAFSPDGRRLLTVSMDGTARLWDPATQRPLTGPLPHPGPVVHGAFSPDGRQVATLTQMGEARLWDALTGTALSLPMQQEGGGQLQFSPDGQSLIVWSVGGGFQVWPIRYEARPLPYLQRLAQVLSQRSLDPHTGMVPADYDLLAPARRAIQAQCPADLRPQRQQSLGWHREQAALAEQQGAWAEAKRHLDVLIQSDPHDPELRRRRGYAYAELHRWAEAARDLRECRPAVEASDYVFLYRLAVTQLAAGDVKGYREICGELLGRFEQSEAKDARDLTTWACTLGPGALPDVQRALRLVDQLLKEEPGNPDFLGTRIALLFRAGRTEEAAGILAQLAVRPGWLPEPVERLLAGLVFHRLGKTDQARTWIERAQQDLRVRRVDWDTAAEYCCLLREAQKILEERP